MEKSNQTFHFTGTINNYGTIAGDVVRPVYHSSAAPADVAAAPVAAAPSAGDSSAVDSSAVDSGSAVAAVLGSGMAEPVPPSPPSPPSPTMSTMPSMPSSLATAEAREELGKYQRAGMLDESYQPVRLTRAQMGCIVIRVGEVLGLAAQWRDFGALWGVKSESLRAQFNQGEASKATRDFCRRLNEV